MTEAGSGAVAASAGIATGTPLGIIANYALTVSPWHWYATNNEAMVGAVTGACAAISTALFAGLLHRPGRPKPFDGEPPELDDAK